MIAAAYGLTVGEVSTSSIHLSSRLVIFQPLNVLQVRRVIKVATASRVDACTQHCWRSCDAGIHWHRVEVTKKDHPLMIRSLLDQGDRLLHLLLPAAASGPADTVPMARPRPVVLCTRGGRLEASRRHPGLGSRAASAAHGITDTHKEQLGADLLALTRAARRNR
jgi:hypothetical protein